MLDGFIKIEDLVKKLSLYNYGACTITDHGNMFGCVEFNTALMDAGIKPIIGNELYLSMGPATLHDKANYNYHMVCLAKNKEGFNTLCKITSESNKKENFYRKPRVDLSILEQYNDGNLIFLTGHHGSLLYHMITNEDDSIKSDAVDIGVALINQLKHRLGTVFIESQRICADKEYCDLMNEIAKKSQTKVIACVDAHYIDRSDAIYQRLLLCSSLNLKLTQVKEKAASLNSFFVNDHYHIPSPEELQIYNSDELDGIHELGEMCSAYSLKEKPTLPRFSDNEEAELKQLCRNGWNKILVPFGINNDSRKREIYAQRVMSELEVISTYDLSGYFLIVQDFIQWVRNQGILCNFGRGCFLPDTKIRMHDGQYKEICNITINDKVIDINGDAQNVYDVLEYQVDEDIIELELENGKIVRCTQDHEFFTENRGWVQAKDLTEDDDIRQI